jgi:hypothetical protein
VIELRKRYLVLSLPTGQWLVPGGTAADKDG